MITWMIHGKEKLWRRAELEITIPSKKSVEERAVNELIPRSKVRE
jgi:hypothetical protein